ncbi:MAG: hypothetical protein QG670_286 [Thermoproteota archaeon]|nr:hypothetical protein [Thermoproteota archaeon]
MNSNTFLHFFAEKKPSKRLISTTEAKNRVSDLPPPQQKSLYERDRKPKTIKLAKFSLIDLTTKYHFSIVIR